MNEEKDTGGTPDRELDIESMKLEDAREYVLAYITAWKRLQKEIGVLQEQIQRWDNRVKAARERDESLLASSTQGQVEKLKSELEIRRREEETLGRKVALLKKKLQAIRDRPSLAVDPDALLQQLQGLAGEPDALSRQLREQEAQAALEELKRKMQK